MSYDMLFILTSIKEHIANIKDTIKISWTFTKF